MTGLCGVVPRGPRTAADEDGAGRGSGPGGGAAPEAESALAALVEAGRHRAPGGVARLGPGGAALAGLLGPCAGGPVADGEDGCAVVADARLDDRTGLIERLGARGEDLRRASDARLILAAYRRWGTSCPVHLLGDFAFAIHDGRRGRLFAARDPMGLRPLHYRVEPDRVLVASEIAQILAATSGAPALSERGVAAYLAGLREDDGGTCYEGVRRLPPGHALVVDADRVRVERWWRLDAGRQIRHRDERAYVEQLRALLAEAVRCRLRPDGPVGLLLSGGLDSGTVAAFGGRLLEAGGEELAPLHAYSWAFEELVECDERAVSGAIADRYGLPVTDVPADDAWPLRDHPAHGPHRDEPYAGVYQPLVERGLAAAREEGMATVMTGHRGDLVAGEHIYDYTGLLLTGRWGRLAREAAVQAEWRGTSTAGEILRRAVLPLRRNLWPPGRAPRLRSAARRAYRAVRPFEPSALPWVERDFLRSAGVEEIPATPATPPELEGARQHARRLRYEAIFAPEHMRGVRWAERLHAAHGLGFADPWSDVRLVEFAVAVPQRVLNVTGEEKRLVRQALEGLVPGEALARAGKVSPFPLYERALRERETDRVLDLLSGAEVERRGWVDAGELRSRFLAYLEGGRFPHGMWWTLALETWLRRYWA